jgi:hypothetical protein
MSWSTSDSCSEIYSVGPDPHFSSLQRTKPTQTNTCESPNYMTRPESTHYGSPHQFPVTSQDSTKLTQKGERPYSSPRQRQTVVRLPWLNGLRCGENSTVWRGGFGGNCDCAIPRIVPWKPRAGFLKFKESISLRLQR